MQKNNKREKQWELMHSHFEYEEAFEWCRWTKEIPSIHFPSEWAIKIIPPFGNAIARFRVNEKISVYLDCYDKLGCCGQPYWEVYPYEGDVYRCGMDDTDELLEAITKSLDDLGLNK